VTDSDHFNAVVDASALIDVLLGLTGDVANLDRATLHAPTVIDYEVLSVARRMSRANRVDRSQALVDGLANVELVRHQAPRMIEFIWGLRENFSAYDAAYVALARSLGAPLLTSDLRLARAAVRYCDVIATN